MSMDIIEELSEGDTALFRRLLFGYLRGCTADCFDKEFKKYVHCSPHNEILAQCLNEMEDNKDRERIACDVANFLIERGFSPHNLGRRVSAALNEIFDYLPMEMQLKTINHWLSSGKLYVMRYYVYNKPLWKFGHEVVRRAWDIADRNNTLNLIGRTMVKEYPLEYLSPWQNILMSHPKINRNEVMLWRLFIRKEKLTNNDWKWLEQNMPLTFIDLSAKKKHPVSDTYCRRIFDSHHTDDLYNLGVGDGGDMLISCFARMHKWDLLKSILQE